MLNSRKIYDEKNIFKGILDNYMYLIIFVFICGGQVIIVIFGSYALKVSKELIPGEAWGIAFAFGFG